MGTDRLGWITNGWRPGSLAWRLREARWRIFSEVIADIPKPVRVLDIGGAEPFWAALDAARNPGELEVTMLNLYPQQTSLPFVRALTGSALDLSAVKAENYDVVFSNSVIEHLGSREDQQRMAEQVRSLGIPYYVQTPNRHFPLEPHFLLPFFQYLPRHARIWLASRWRHGSYCRVGNRVAATAAVDEIRLLSAREMQVLFPDANLHHERIGPLTKSFMAVGRGSS
jgi:hypothetical protein